MAFKIIAALAFIGVASALYEKSAVVDESAPVKVLEGHNSYPQYAFTYGVHDTVSGDSKNHFETRNGDIVHGQYSLNDPDGYKRIVDYTADATNGFNAVVDRKPIVNDVSVIPEPVVVKSITDSHAVKTLAPVTYAVPSVPLSYAAPTYVKSIPATYVTRSIYEPTLRYGSNLGTFPITYSGPTLVKSAPIAYTGPIAYTASSWS